MSNKNIIQQRDYNDQISDLKYFLLLVGSSNDIIIRKVTCYKDGSGQIEVKINLSKRDIENIIKIISKPD